MVAPVKRRISEEDVAARNANTRQAVTLRAEAFYPESAPLTGFEDESTRDLILANHFLRRGGTVSLRPLLPLLLRLKGKPYRLKDYFPFEPFFRTRMAKTTLLKTGRQVSKCVPEDELALTPRGWVPVGRLKIGDLVIGWNGRRFVSAKVTTTWRVGRKSCSRLITNDGRSTRASSDHRFLVRDSDNHQEGFRELQHIYRGDYVASRSDNGKLFWARVESLIPLDEPVEMVDIEVAELENFVLAGYVSHNSTSLAAQGVVFSNSIPYFSTLYVTPLFEMVRRFSHNYVRDFLDQSPVKNLWMNSSTTNSVLQRTFRNGAAMYFSYAFLDAERTRGIPADKNVIDEVQDMNFDFLKIIHETLSGSPWGLKQYAGTPKSLDNTMERLWVDSSQAEWMIKCRVGGCNHWNVPALDWDLLDMIGPWHRDINEKCPGVVCSQCRKPLDPRTGRWVHANPERHWEFAGYHVPQIIMPMHYGNHEKWDVLVGKSQGRGNMTTTTFLNEVCGESCDSGSKLVTVTDLKAAAVLPWRPRAAEATKHLKRYVRRVLAVDWGGGGGAIRAGAAKKGGELQRQRTSYTTLAVLGLLPDGKIDVIWGHRSLRTHDFEYEARLCVEALSLFKCTHIAHDYTGAGSGRLVLLYQCGIPPSNIINMRYQGIGHNIMNYHEPTDDNPHAWYALDKSRSLVTTCMCLKYGLIRTFQYDFVSADQAGLLHDFLALIEEKVDSRIASDTYVIVRNPNQSDDFAHSVNMGACTLWWMTKRWPNIAEAARFVIPKEKLKHIHPIAKVDWDDI